MWYEWCCRSSHNSTVAPPKEFSRIKLSVVQCLSNAMLCREENRYCEKCWLKSLHLTLGCQVNRLSHNITNLSERKPNIKRPCELILTNTYKENILRILKGLHKQSITKMAPDNHQQRYATNKPSFFFFTFTRLRCAKVKAMIQKRTLCG